jgi:hypothetical protein
MMGGVLLLRFPTWKCNDCAPDGTTDGKEISEMGDCAFGRERRNPMRNSVEPRFGRRPFGNSIWALRSSNFKSSMEQVMQCWFTLPCCTVPPRLVSYDSPAVIMQISIAYIFIFDDVLVIEGFCSLFYRIDRSAELDFIP